MFKFKKSVGKSYLINTCNNLDFPSPIIKTNLDSTSTHLRFLAENGASHGTIVISDRQSAGRGRMGKSFLSPDGGLYMSILLKRDLMSDSLGLITPAAAVATAMAIKDVFDIDVSVKWVNDLFYNERKVCGILTEVVRDPTDEQIKYVVLGIGVNVFKPRRGFGELSSIAGSLLKGSKDRNTIYRLASQITENFFRLWNINMHTTIYHEYKKRLFILSNKIYILRGNEKHTATVRELENDFSLTVEYADGRREKLFSGEISIIPHLNS